MADFESYGIAFFAHSDNTVSELKGLIKDYAQRAVENFSPSTGLVLQYRGQDMADDRTLESYGITGDPYVVGAYLVRVLGGKETVY
mmetsp:Transcript_62267/g.124787  ORF Transcript_62267/g.124787 Transcript_62267/m.124787 type:complete len:86 (-) Transcript_62267:41-298(-)